MVGVGARLAVCAMDWKRFWWAILKSLIALESEVKQRKARVVLAFWLCVWQAACSLPEHVVYHAAVKKKSENEFIISNAFNNRPNNKCINTPRLVIIINHSTNLFTPLNVTSKYIVLCFA